MSHDGMPTVSELADEIYAQGKYLRDNYFADDLQDGDFCGTDCRLQVVDGGWYLHTGDSSYDQDHRGTWSCGSIERGITRRAARELAHELIDANE